MSSFVRSTLYLDPISSNSSSSLGKCDKTVVNTNRAPQWSPLAAASLTKPSLRSAVKELPPGKVLHWTSPAASSGPGSPNSQGHDAHLASPEIEWRPHPGGPPDDPGHLLAQEKGHRTSSHKSRDVSITLLSPGN
jgi:hypothetical protein